MPLSGEGGRISCGAGAGGLTISVILRRIRDHRTAWESALCKTICIFERRRPAGVDIRPSEAEQASYRDKRLDTRRGRDKAEAG